MGGAAKAIGLGGPKTAQAVEAVKAAEPKPEMKASRMDEEQGARMRGARRRGRALLADARLNPEGGETLGGGQSLG